MVWDSVWGSSGDVGDDGDDGECRRSGELSRGWDVRHGGRQLPDVEITIWDSADVEVTIFFSFIHYLRASIAT